MSQPGDPREAAERDVMGDPDRVVITDKRRFRPDGTPRVTVEPVLEGEVVEDDQEVGSGNQAPAGEAAAGDLLAEMTATAQRVSAEYANYRKRVERDRIAVVEMATAGLLGGLLPLLDDVERARQHGDLTGAFKSVGEALEGVAAKLGLERFGDVDDPFDPAVHEALMAAPEHPTATVPVCAQVIQQGYRLAGGRVLRPARVAVAEPSSAAAGPPPDPQPEP